MQLIGLRLLCAVLIVPGFSGAASAQVAPSPADLIFAPIVSCRVFDTRATAPIAANTTRSFHVSGSSDFPPQGGPEHGCGVPKYATAVSISLVAVDEEAAGFLTAYAYNTKRPTGVSLYYQERVTLANALVSSINFGNISIYSSKKTHVAADVTGYYAPQMHAHVTSDATLVNGSRVLSVTKVSAGFYNIVFDRENLRGCESTASAEYSNYNATTYIGNTGIGSTVFVRMYDATGVLADYPFSLSIHC